METAIRWSSNSTLSEQRFLLADVSGRSFKHAKVTSYDGKSLKYDLISTYPKVPPFRAFDWAPFDENLVAVGQWSGEATILRIDDTAAPLSLPTKHQRLCNAVTFSNAGILATGLERVRNVECLNLWDINQRLSSTPSPPPTRPGKAVEPYRKFSSSGAISSIKFSIRTPEILIAGVKGFGIRVYDLRENGGNASSQFQTQCVHNVAIDPLNENYFACCATGKDTTIQIWDCRSGSPYMAPGYGVTGDQGNQSSPVVEYAEAFASATNDATPPNTWSSRFCKGKSGFLGALASNGHFKVFETTVGYSKSGNSSTSHMTSTSSPTERVFTKRVHQIERPFDDVHQTRQESDRIVAFDFTNLAGSKGTPSAILLRGNGSVSIQELSGPPMAFSFSPMGPLSVSRQETRLDTNLTEFPENDASFSKIRTYLPISKGLGEKFPNIVDMTSAHQGQILDEKFNEKPSEETAESNNVRLQNRAAHELAISNLGPRSFEDVLTSLTTARRRCLARYNLDPEKNINIVDDDEWLQKLWIWIARAQTNANDEGMIAAGFDLSYLGIFDIWGSDPSLEQESRRRTAFEIATDLNDAVIARAETLEQIFPDWQVDSQAHRLVCLHTCGIGLSPEQLEVSVQELSSNNEKIKAAALAVFHNNGKLAIETLRSATVSTLDRELSLALAAYLSGLMDDGNDTWSQTILNLAIEVSDPYARAILAIVSHGDWHDVLQETSLPLSDRVSIALMYLSDDELTTYINATTEEVIQAGDIEGIVLTGLGPKAVPLFENYIRKFSDLQTTVLSFAFASPRYFDDPRVESWRETYRHQLDDLNLFIQRAHFDTMHTQLSLSQNGTLNLGPPPRQISIRCAYCDNALDRNPDNDATPKNTKTSTYGVRRGSIFGVAGKSGTSCPKCGRHMPRCAVCLKWVGTPDPHTKGAMAMNETFEEAFDNFTSICLNCWHVTHVGHGEAWFRSHAVCPATGCNCRCVEVDRGFA